MALVLEWLLFGQGQKRPPSGLYHILAHNGKSVGFTFNYLPGKHFQIKLTKKLTSRQQAARFLFTYSITNSEGQVEYFNFKRTSNSDVCLTALTSQRDSIQACT